MRKFGTIVIVLLLIVGLLAGCKKESPVILINDGEVEVPIEEVFFYVYNLQAQYESDYGEDILLQPVSEGVTLGDSLKKDALDTAVVVNLCALVAEKEGITLDPEIEASLKADALSYFEAISQEEIEKYKFSAELFEEVFIEYALRGELMEAYALNTPIDETRLEADLVAYEEEDPYFALIRQKGMEEAGIKMRAKHILVYTLDENGDPLDEAGMAAAYDRILEVQDRLANGEDFVELVKEYSDDPGSKDTEGEYTFTLGQMTPPFEEAALGLEIGEISGIVETEYGYHIIKLEETGIPPNEEDIATMEAYVTKITNDAKETQSQVLFEEQYKAWTEEYKIQINQGIWNAVYVKGETMSADQVPAE
ncbi:MAG: peptidylprolyl isomerase [Vallitaleaceae bacterium]|jgi:hypothetical protein|nr:peptidylprolyl isomerase [Vallitaleaceae bacterium]